MMANWCDRQDLLDKIIADLRGTCQNLEEVAEYWKAGELSLADLQYIESEVFQCEGCGWWCSTWEQHDTGYGILCDDCFNEEMEEDEEE